MKKIAILAFTLLPYLSLAQHENHYQEIEPIDTEAYKLSFSDQHSQKGFFFMKTDIQNKSDDYLLFKPHETNFKISGGVFHPDEEHLIIPPGEEETHKFKITGDANFHVKSLSVDLKGLHRFSSEGEVQKAEPFKLPPSKNSFKVGDGSFECQLDGDVKKETDVTKAAFECTYKGEGVGLVNHKKISVKTEEGDEFRNKKKKGAFGKVTGKKTTKTLLKGESTTVKTQFEVPAKVADMQFATLFIHWNDCFREASPKAFDAEKLELKLDEAKTQGMND